MYLKEADLTSLQTSWHFIKRCLIHGNLEQSNSCQGNEEEQLTGGSPAKGLHPHGSYTVLPWTLLESHWKHILKENKPNHNQQWLQSGKGGKSKLNKIHRCPTKWVTFKCTKGEKVLLLHVHGTRHSIPTNNTKLGQCWHNQSHPYR